MFFHVSPAIPVVQLQWTVCRRYSRYMGFAVVLLHTETYPAAAQQFVRVQWSWLGERDTQRSRRCWVSNGSNRGVGGRKILVPRVDSTNHTLVSSFRFMSETTLPFLALCACMATRRWSYAELSATCARTLSPDLRTMRAHHAHDIFWWTGMCSHNCVWSHEYGFFNWSFVSV